jgi:hypothetical protein
MLRDRVPACDTGTSRVEASAVAVKVRFASTIQSMIGLSIPWPRRHDGQR